MATESRRPGADLDKLKTRARMLAAIRAFFAARGVMEVETPILSQAAATDPHLDSFATRYHGPGLPAGQTLYLHTSPEFPMKRLLAAGSGPIYQLCKVFRQGERGRRHNPEFTLLEWYRPGWGHHALMDEVEALVRQCLGASRALAPAERLTYAQVFQRHAGIDPLQASVDGLRACARAHGLTMADGAEDADRDFWCDLLMSHIVEPQLGQGRPTFIHEYPASQAALARLVPGRPEVAARFELYLEGVELANGFHELADAAEQRARFEQGNRRRAAQNQPAMPVDERLLAALAHGLPDCSGVALGVDRLAMLACGVSDIDGVIAFPLEQA